MGAATVPTDLSDLRTAFLNAVRESTGVTATNTIVDRYLNVALHFIHSRWVFPWSVRRGTILTQPQYTTGTIDVTKGSTSVAGTTTLWNTANDFGVNNVRAGGKIVFSSTEGVYEVSSVTSNTALTLVNRYTGSTITAGTYRYFEDEYSLESDFLAPVDPRIFSTNLPIMLIPRPEFYRRYPRNDQTGTPRVATLIQLDFSSNTTPRPRIVFHPPPDKAYKIDYHFRTSNLAVTSAGAEQTQLTATTDEPILPLRYRIAIVYHALSDWYRDRKNDTRSQEALGRFNEIMRMMTADTDESQGRARFAPRRWLASIYRPWRRGRRYETGTEFDDMRM